MVNIEINIADAPCSSEDTTRALAHFTLFAAGQEVPGVEAVVIAKAEDGRLVLCSLPEGRCLETSRERWRHVLAMTIASTRSRLDLPKRGTP